MRLNKTISSLVVFLVLVCATNSFALTIEFEDLPPATSYNVGGTFYPSSVPVTVEDISGGMAFVSNAGLAAGSGQEIGINNVKLNFSFGPLDGLSMQFGEGPNNTDARITVNGNTISGTSFVGLGGLIAGTNVTLFVIPTGINTGALFFMGDITSFVIGGEDIYIDNIVASQIPEPATLALLGLGGLALRRKKRAA